MATKKLPFAALQTSCAYKRNKYRNLVIEFHARNSPSVLAVTHRRWPDGAWSSYPELARLLSSEVGWNVDYRSLTRQMRKIQRFDQKVSERIREIVQ